MPWIANPLSPVRLWVAPPSSFLVIRHYASIDLQNYHWRTTFIMIGTLLILIVVGVFAITGVFIMRDTKKDKDADSKNNSKK